MAATKTSSVTLSTNRIEIVRDAAANNIAEIIPLSAIVDVSGVFNAKPVSATPEEWAYPYTNMTQLCIHLKDHRYVYLELQEVSNKATWNLGTKAALQQAITDIKALF